MSHKCLGGFVAGPCIAVALGSVYDLAASIVEVKLAFEVKTSSGICTFRSKVRT